MQSDDDLFKEFESKHSAAELGYEAYIAAVKEHLPDPDAYYRFCGARSRASLEEFYTAIPPDDFVRQVDAMNFANSDDEVALRRIQLHGSRPIVPLGHDAAGMRYRLIPDSYGLDPSTTFPEPTAASGLKLLPATLLGVNTASDSAAATCAPDSRRDRHSAISTLSADSDDDSNGFCLCQLGTLESLPGNLDISRPHVEDLWYNTGFVVVVRTTASGAADGIYIIISNQPIYEDDAYDDDEGTPPKPVSHPGASLWESPPEPLFSCARVSGITKLADCSPDYGTLLSWVDRVHNPVEIVPAVLNWKGLVLRATVEEL